MNYTAKTYEQHITTKAKTLKTAAKNYKLIFLDLHHGYTPFVTKGHAKQLANNGYINDDNTFTQMAFDVAAKANDLGNL